jgi:ribosomal protein S18 acetylase RimI-like enzyme
LDLGARQHASHVAFNERLCARTVPVGRVTAGVTPAAAERSLPNAVLYTDPADVLAVHDDLVALYAEAGVRAWTVWVEPGDDELARGLEARGHAFDGRPMKMAAPLEEVDLSAAAPERIEPVTDWRVVGEINDAAYGLAGLADTFAAYRDDDTRGWLAIADDRPAATVSVLEHDGDAYVAFVATDPAFRGRGLCRGLLAHALRVAADNGCTTTSLEGSPDGEPIYARLGYRALGRFGLWELRNNTA